MEELYYITPYIQMWIVGDGTYSLDSGIRQANGPRVLLSGNWSGEPKTSSVIPVSARGRAKGHSITWVLTTPAHHAAIQADSENILVPFGPADLDNAYSTLTAQEQSGLEAFLETIFMDSQWIQQGALLRDIVSYVIHVIFTGQQLGSDYPDRPLNSRWNALPANEGAAVSAFLSDYSRPAVSGNPQIRDIINSMAQADFGPIRFGNQDFGNWTP